MNCTLLATTEESGMVRRIHGIVTAMLMQVPPDNAIMVVSIPTIDSGQMQRVKVIIGREEHVQICSIIYDFD